MGIFEFRPHSRVRGPQILGSKNYAIPYFSPNFGLRELKVFEPSEVQETHLRFQFQDPIPKNKAWGAILKNRIFRL